MLQNPPESLDLSHSSDHAVPFSNNRRADAVDCILASAG